MGGYGTATHLIVVRSSGIFEVTFSCARRHLLVLLCCRGSGFVCSVELGQQIIVYMSYCKKHHRIIEAFLVETEGSFPVAESGSEF